MGESIKSKYRPQYPKKYKGDASNIICRSSWERKFCSWCDSNKNIIEWEEISYDRFIFEIKLIISDILGNAALYQFLVGSCHP